MVTFSLGVVRQAGILWATNNEATLVTPVSRQFCWFPKAAIVPTSERSRMIESLSNKKTTVVKESCKTLFGLSAKNTGKRKLTACWVCSLSLPECAASHDSWKHCNSRYEAPSRVRRRFSCDHLFPQTGIPQTENLILRKWSPQPKSL